MAVSHTCIVQAVVPYLKAWTPLDLNEDVPVPPLGVEGGKFYTWAPWGGKFYTWASWGRKTLAWWQEAFSHLEGSAAYQPFHLPGSNLSLLLNKGSFVMIILWWWECTPSAPVRFLCRSEVLHNTQKLSSSRLVEGCKPGLSKAPAAFASLQLFKSFNL